MRANTEIATHGSYTLIATIDGRVMLRTKSGAILNEPDAGLPLIFGSVASAVAWIRAVS